MFAILHALGMFVADLFKSRSRLEAENLLLRHQLTIALRQAPPRLRLRGGDRALLIWMTRLWPSLLGVAQVVQPETILRWHRAGFKALPIGRNEDFGTSPFFGQLFGQVSACLYVPLNGRAGGKQQ